MATIHTVSSILCQGSDGARGPRGTRRVWPGSDHRKVRQEDSISSLEDAPLSSVSVQNLIDYSRTIEEILSCKKFPCQKTEKDTLSHTCANTVEIGSPPRNNVVRFCYSVIRSRCMSKREFPGAIIGLLGIAVLISMTGCPNPTSD